VKLDEMQPPAHYKMLLDGKGKRGFIKGVGTLDLEEQNGQTLLKYTGDVQIGGPLASVGQRMVDGAAKMMIGQFFAAMEAEIKAMPGEEVRQGAAVNFWRYLLKVIREKLAALFGENSSVVILNRNGKRNRETQRRENRRKCFCLSDSPILRFSDSGFRFSLWS
jgi:hypothetical protein